MTKIVTRTLADLPALGPDFFARGVEGEPTRALYDKLAAEAEVLDAIEVRAAAAGNRLDLKKKVRVAAWNLERCKAVEASAKLLLETGADIALVSEMDAGMARSGNRHTIREGAATLDAGYAFAVEFIELGLGTPEEEAHFAGKSNELGLHGNGIVSTLPFRDPYAIRLDEGAIWFALDWHHRRVGGRNAIGVTLDFGETPVEFISAHFETLTKPEGRALQIERILAFLEARGPSRPAIIAGDFNAATLPELNRPDIDLAWFERPEVYEPMFAALRDAGFDFRFEWSQFYQGMTKATGDKSWQYGGKSDPQVRIDLSKFKPVEPL